MYKRIDIIGAADFDEDSTRQASRHPTGALKKITSPLRLRSGQAYRRRLNDVAFTLGALLGNDFEE